MDWNPLNNPLSPQAYVAYKIMTVNDDAEDDECDAGDGWDR